MKCPKSKGKCLASIDELSGVDGINRECQNCGAIYYFHVSHTDYIEDTSA